MRATALGLALLALLGLAIISGFRPLYFLFYLSLLVFGLAYLWTLLQTLGLEVEVENLGSRPQVGRPLQLRVTVKEKLGLPRIALRFRITGQKTDSTERIISLRPKASATWTTLVKDHHRGYNLIGTLTAVASDPFGLSKLEANIGESHSIMVYPSVVSLSPGLSIGSSVIGDIGDVSQMAAASTSASRIREYRPGDSLAHIHWPSTAKTDKLMTKEFNSGGHNEVWIFLDLEAAVQAGSGPESTEEYGVTIAASLAKNLVEARQLVGLVTQGDNLYHITPNRDPDHVWNLLTALALGKGEGHISMPTLMVKESIGLAPGSIAVVISPGQAKSQTAISQYLYRQGISLMPILIDAASFGAEVDEKESRIAPGGAYLVRRGDNLTHSLANVMDRLVY